jgi:hypothetical protein
MPYATPLRSVYSSASGRLDIPVARLVVSAKAESHLVMLTQISAPERAMESGTRLDADHHNFPRVALHLRTLPGRADTEFESDNQMGG